jgi:hypothetical protein
VEGGDFDGGGGVGDEGGVGVLETLRVAGEEDDVLYAFGGECCGRVLGVGQCRERWRGEGCGRCRCLGRRRRR